ncbi:MAG: DUF4198 domain-containing protein [Comamonas sp.]
MQARHLFAALAATFSLNVAQAHMPFLLPSVFDVQPKSTISVDAGFAEKLFLSEVQFGATPFSLTTPAGTVLPFGEVHQFKTRTVAEQKLPDEKGTYRLSSGPRLGAIFRSWEVNGKTTVARDPKEIMPEGGVMKSHYQSLSVSEAYVTAGAPTPIKPYGKGLEIVPSTHPSDLFAAEKFNFAVHFDGKPLADQKVSIYRSPMDLQGQNSVDELSTDAQGDISWAPAKPGIYMALVRHRAPAPEGAAAPTYGHNYTLTFRVIAQ